MTRPTATTHSTRFDATPAHAGTRTCCCCHPAYADSPAADAGEPPAAEPQRLASSSSEPERPEGEAHQTQPAVLLLTVQQAARVLAVGRSTVYGLISSGALASVKVGGSRRVSINALEAYVTALLAGGSRTPLIR